MLRVLCLALLMAASGPVLATEQPVSSGDTVAQQQKPAPQQTPRRDCERQQEGIS